MGGLDIRLKLIYYQLCFRLQEDYDNAVAVAGGEYYYAAPRDAAATLGIGYPYPNINFGIQELDSFVVFSPGEAPGDTIYNPGDSGTTYDDTKLNKLISGQVGYPYLDRTGPDIMLRWCGSVVKIPERGAGPEDELPTISRRRWAVGFELYPGMEGTSGGNIGLYSRDASRTMDGLGCSLRGNFSASFTHVTAVSAFLSPRTSWERFYFRWRRAGSGDNAFWRCHQYPSAQMGAILNIDPSGSIFATVSDAIGQIVNLGTVGSAIIDDWIKFDVIVEYSPGGDPVQPGRLRIFMNGELVGAFSDLHGLGQGIHLNSQLGAIFTLDSDIQYDLDDWICSDIPTKIIEGVAVESLETPDFICGSHVRRHFALAGESTGWIGNVSSVDQGISPYAQSNSALTSIIPAAEIEVQTDADDIQNCTGIFLGAVAATIGMQGYNFGGTSGQLGYSIPEIGDVLETIIQSPSPDHAASMMWHGGGILEPILLTPFSIKHIKSNDANLCQVNALCATVEYIGIWGKEDSIEFPDFYPRKTQLHNCRYPNSAWGNPGPPSLSPVYAVGGTYVGNGISQEIALPELCHFLWIRPLSGGSGGVKFFGASLTGHLGTTDKAIPNYPVRLYVDTLTSEINFLVSGTDSQINASGITYQYIAFCDPGMRFNLCGAFQNQASISPISNELQLPNFQALFSFFQIETMALSTNTGLAVKGPGHIDTTGNFLNGVAITDLALVSTGEIISGIAINDNALVTNYSLWRTTDDCINVMVQILTYMGDGTGTRIIDLTPVSSRYPLFAMVVPHNGPGYFRDPSHSSMNSSNVSTLGISTSAIIAGGVDTITVGNSLNQIDIIYEVFVIPGDILGWINGTYYPTNCEMIIEPPPTIPADVIGAGAGGLTLNGSVPITILKDISGIYTLVPGKTNDTLYDRQSGQISVDVKIPNPKAKTGYVGG